MGYSIYNDVAKIKKREYYLFKKETDTDWYKKLVNRTYNHYLKHRKRYNSLSLKRYYSNREKYLNYSRIYALNNKDKACKRSLKYHAKNRDKMLLKLKNRNKKWEYRLQVKIYNRIKTCIPLKIIRENRLKLEKMIFDMNGGKQDGRRK